MHLEEGGDHLLLCTVVSVHHTDTVYHNCICICISYRHVYLYANLLCHIHTHAHAHAYVYVCLVCITIMDYPFASEGKEHDMTSYVLCHYRHLRSPFKHKTRPSLS